MNATDEIASRRLLVHWLRRQGNNRAIAVNRVKRQCTWLGPRSGAIQALDGLACEGVGQWELIPANGGRLTLAFRLLPDKTD